MRHSIKTLILVLSSFIAVNAYGQSSIEALQQLIKKAEQEIELNTKLLDKTRNEKQLSQKQLKLIESRINSRKQMVANLEKQINLITDDITGKNRRIDRMNRDIDNLKKEYAEMVRAAYKNYKLNNFVLFLFASEDFNDATRRIEFMRRYNRMREDKTRQIRSMSDSIANEIAELDRQKAELDGTRTSRTKEISELGKDETQYKTSVSKLASEEAKISKQIKAKQQERDKAQKEIERIIAEEAKKAKGEVRTEAESRYITELSGKFDDNKGKLPYPVRGVIIDRYGKHNHPTQKGLIVDNKGVNIAGDPGADVRSVFEGTVSRVFFVQGLNNCVMIRHGNFITLYANLASVSVKKDQKISLNQSLGKLSTVAEDAHVHFEIWKETTNLNPEQWLAK